jgi:hypothetical protein
MDDPLFTIKPNELLILLVVPTLQYSGHNHGIVLAPSNFFESILPKKKSGKFWSICIGLMLAGHCPKVTTFMPILQAKSDVAALTLNRLAKEVYRQGRSKRVFLPGLVVIK